MIYHPRPSFAERVARRYRKFSKPRALMIACSTIFSLSAVTYFTPQGVDYFFPLEAAVDTKGCLTTAFKKNASRVVTENTSYNTVVTGTLPDKTRVIMTSDFKAKGGVGMQRADGEPLKPTKFTRQLLNDATQLCIPGARIRTAGNSMDAD